MNVKNHPIQQITKQEKLTQDYLNKSENLSQLITAFPSIENFEKAIDSKKFDSIKRVMLAEILSAQYDGLQILPQVKKNIESLREENTYTVTTGHQLCLFTGPLYFIYKIISTIKLAEELSKKYPQQKFVPVYWMATEDHDLAEINHAYFYGKKIVWQTNQTGAVGMMHTEGIMQVIDEITEVLGTSGNAVQIIELLRKAYSEKDLAKATRYLVNELFGKYGVVVIDGNNRDFKAMFKPVIKDELFAHNGFHAVSATNKYLNEHDYKVQVNPREINLFYIEEGIRSRIEQKDENTWQVVDTDKTFTREQLEELLENTPEVFSPNVILRPLYQETVLPNLAYIGGPGELSYWLQLKSFFDKEQLVFPVLVLRDSALLLNAKTLQRIDKLGLTPLDLFDNPQDIIKRLVHSDITSLENEKNQIKQIFDTIAAKLKAADNTLESSALAEAQKQLSAIDHLEKKALKALKTKEEIKINQFQKLHNECFPDGTPQERHDNFFQQLFIFGESLTEDLYASFNPLKQEYHILEQ